MPETVPTAKALEDMNAVELVAYFKDQIGDIVEQDHDDTTTAAQCREIYQTAKAEHPPIAKLVRLPQFDKLVTEAVKARKSAKKAEMISAMENPFAQIGDPMERYAVVIIGGSTRVYDKKQKTFMRKRDFIDLFEMFPPPTLDADDEVKSYGEWWFKNPERPTFFNGTGMYPDAEAPEGVLNLWKGWGVDPQPSGNITPDEPLGLFLQYLKNDICKGKQQNYSYVIRWLAWVVQNPGKRAEVALAIQGVQGTGKGFLMKVMTKIFGEDHSFIVSNPSSLTGDFNAWMRDCLFVGVDEAFSAGDKRAKNRLKSLITDGVTSVNQKNIDEVQVKNRLSFIFVSNDSWFIDLDADDRRFFILNASTENAKDDVYFKPLFDGMIKKGGAAQLFHLLRNMKLGDWHPRHIHMTDEKRVQIFNSMNDVQKWAWHLLATGGQELNRFVVDYGYGAIHDEDGSIDHITSWSKGTVSLPSTRLTQAFENYTYGRNYGAKNRHASGSVVGKFLTKLGVKTTNRTRTDHVKQLPNLNRMRQNFATEVFNCPWEQVVEAIENDD